MVMIFLKCAGGCGKYTWRNEKYCLTCLRKEEAKNKEDLKIEEPPKKYVDDYYKETINANPENNVKGRKIYYCFQGKQFVNEASRGYIFALDKPFHHWARLKELKKGDIIFHGTEQGIVAISIVEERYTYGKRPKEHYLANDFKDATGLMVKTQYDFIDKPILTIEYIQEINQFQGNHRGKGYPFNKNGTGNQGYLFNLNGKLAQFFMAEIIKRNPSMADREYAKVLL